MLVDKSGEIFVGENPADRTLGVKIADAQLTGAGLGHGADAIGQAVECEIEGDSVGRNLKVSILYRAGRRVGQREQVVEHRLIDAHRAAGELSGTRGVDLLNGTIQGGV
uniref:Uncharacterized protein n=1 Tax=Thermogemmatispora argillosa TaxID=2045280 RepID=A0A455SZ35_9CHLR|nr:hypothetical protein KTA_10070 [Thermogemmatispora argillosa]